MILIELSNQIGNTFRCEPRPRQFKGELIKASRVLQQVNGRHYPCPHIAILNNRQIQPTEGEARHVLLIFKFSQFKTRINTDFTKQFVGYDLTRNFLVYVAGG